MGAHPGGVADGVGEGRGDGVERRFAHRLRAGGAEGDGAADEGTETIDATDADPESIEDDEETAAEIPTPDAVADIDIDAEIPLGTDEN